MFMSLFCKKGLRVCAVMLHLGDVCVLVFVCVCAVFFFLQRFIAQTVYTVCKRINYKIVPVNNLYKFSHCGLSGTE